CSQINSLDMGLSGMMTIALCALLLAQRNDATAQEQRNWMLVCWAGMALSMLAKGLIGVVLPGAILVLYTLFARDWKIWTRLHIGKGLLLSFAIAAPWFIAVGLKNPEQPHFFFIHEHFERFLLKEHHREAAWYLFFVLLFAGSVPWAGVLVQSLVLGAKREPAGERAPGPFRPRLMLLVWMAFIVLFFTKSNSKLPGYILPVFPAVALLIADYLDVGTRRSRMLTSGITALIGVALLATVPFMKGFAKHPGEDVLFAAYQPWVMAAGFVVALGGVLALVYARQMKRDLMVVALALCTFAGTELMMSGFEPIAQARAGTNLLPAVRKELAANTTIYSVGIYEQSLTFYLRRPVVLVDYWDEFTFGLEQEPQLSIPTVAQFVAKWRADAAGGHHDMAIIRDDIVADLKKQGVPLRVVAADSRRTIIANY
ncbi:MAG: glycosyltransferase family 39 protein, partial [Telluria sp.]